MAASNTLLSLITPAPYLPHKLLVKRAEVTCGDLRGGYTNVKAPVCAGQSSICTFTNGLQGCCDDSSSCQFYTTCLGGYAETTCTGSRCLTCPRSAPYCIKYNFLDSSGRQAYEAHSCGGLQVDSLIIYGFATSIGNITNTASSASTTSSSATRSETSTSTSTATEPEVTFMQKTSSNSRAYAGPIAGGIIGGLAVLAFAGGAIWFYKKRFRRDSRGRHRPIQETGLEVQQHYGEGDTLRLNP